MMPVIVSLVSVLTNPECYGQLLENIQELEAANRALESQKKDDVFTVSNS